ncbi:very long chain fatty acid elongase 7 [Drosophila bipectinata]|uniref:very long chain fatty acid elongase 7 n=1 Tax=Drosophila bipectinata TaxID=42026 RepID=UPI001C89B35F|nr:elongation of very long chain fatty acids protein 7 [Drosophila bipectinata]
MDTSTGTLLNGAVKHPLLLADPWFMITVLGLYLYVVNSVLPQFMLFRKPFELKKFMLLHNVIQVVSCIYVIREILFVTDNGVIYFWKCRQLSQSTENVRRHFSLAYFLFWLKLSELVETMIFVLRQKQNQVTKLHLFHHVATLTLVYLLIHYNQNGSSAYFCAFLNSIVHIIMYSYYFVAAVADKSIVRTLQPIKKSITVIQMVQFALILVQLPTQIVLCGVPRGVIIYFGTVIIAMFYGFYDFYTNAYKSDHRVKNRE